MPHLQRKQLVAHLQSQRPWLSCHFQCQRRGHFQFQWPTVSDAGPDCRHFQYCAGVRATSRATVPASTALSLLVPTAVPDPRVGLFLLWRLRRSLCSGRFDGQRHVRTSQASRESNSTLISCLEHEREKAVPCSSPEKVAPRSSLVLRARQEESSLALISRESSMVLISCLEKMRERE